MKKVLVIAGPTGVGKTAFSIEIAKRLQTEIISGDSIQVYRGLDIGSGKVKEQEKQGIIHHLIDIKNPDEPYSVADFQLAARSLIETISLPVIAGGTGLYLKACLYDYVFKEEKESAAVDPALEDLSNEELYRRLCEADPVQAEKIHPNNRRRLLRSLTIYKRTGMPQSAHEREQEHKLLYDALVIGCTAERAKLYERIDSRVEGMFEEGLKEEVRRLLDRGYGFDAPAMQGIGYREWRAYFEGNAGEEEVKREIQKHSRQYAKRQYTWLNHQMPVHWADLSKPEEKERILGEIITWAEN